MNTVADIFHGLGGNKRVSEIIGAGRSTVSEMKRRNTIPPRWWQDILQSKEAKTIGLKVDHLLPLHVPRQVNKRSSCEKVEAA